MASKEQVMSIFTGINQLYSGQGKIHLFQYLMYNGAALSVHGKHKRAVKAWADISCGHRALVWSPPHEKLSHVSKTPEPLLLDESV